MGSYLFKWTHPASEVFVTGTFDDWGKSVKLEKIGDLHEKLVQLPKADEKILYKFVVDGNWTNDHTVPTETDSNGYANNVLMPHQIDKSGGAAGLVGSTISNSAANTTTQQLAGQVPKEGVAANAISNTAGNTTTQSLAGQVPKEAAVPGAFPEEPAGDVKVDPIPATAGAGNPIQLKAGDPVPPSSTITGNTVASTATTDKAAYEKGLPVLPNVVTPEAERGAGLFGLPDQSKNVIPESSLPIAGGPATDTINSSGAFASSARLAGLVPHESRGVPQVVKDSQAKADFGPEASANPEAVEEKRGVEAELESKVPEEQPTTESTLGGKATAAFGAAAAGVGAAAAGAAAYISSGKAKDDTKATLPESTHAAIDKVAPNGSASGETSGAVPERVQESIHDAKWSPEAAGNVEAVAEKSEVEDQLLKNVTREDSTGRHAPTDAAAATAEAPKATMKSTEAPLRDTARDQAATAATAATGGTGGGSLAAAVADAKQTGDSRDVSPMTRHDGTHATEHLQGGPTVTTGVGSSKAPKVSSGKATGSNPASPLSAKSTDAAKKDKRSSGFFRKLKDRFDHKEKEKK